MATRVSVRCVSTFAAMKPMASVSAIVEMDAEVVATHRLGIFPRNKILVNEIHHLAVSISVPERVNIPIYRLHTYVAVV